MNVASLREFKSYEQGQWHSEKERNEQAVDNDHSGAIGYEIKT
jgi:hypothetical protein